MESPSSENGHVWYWDYKNKQWVKKGEELKRCTCHSGKVCAYCMGLAGRQS